MSPRVPEYHKPKPPQRLIPWLRIMLVLFVVADFFVIRHLKEWSDEAIRAGQFDVEWGSGNYQPLRIFSRLVITVSLSLFMLGVQLVLVILVARRRS